MKPRHIRITVREFRDGRVVVSAERRMPGGDTMSVHGPASEKVQRKAEELFKLAMKGERP